MDRLQADVESLDYAVRLGRDEVDLSHLPGKSTGKRSWDLWARQLADQGLHGPHFYHANVVLHLRQNRTGAAKYLREMSTRHAPLVRDSLVAAASEYEAVVAKLQRANTSEDALSMATGRKELISLIREMVSLEAKAQERMAEAIRAMR